MHALKQWKSVTGRSAWTFSETRQQYYLHHYLPEMPDLNLKQPQLREEIKAIFRHWLSQNGVMGVHIGSLDLLIENEDNTLQIEPDVKQCVEFLTGLVTNTFLFSPQDTVYPKMKDLGIIHLISFKNWNIR